MTSYIARTGGQKKKNILRQKELVLRGDLRRLASEGKLNKSAENVRSAQLGVMKVLIHELEPGRMEDVNQVADRIQRLEDATTFWSNISTHEIISIYSSEDHDPISIDRKRWWDFRPR